MKYTSNLEEAAQLLTVLNEMIAGVQAEIEKLNERKPSTPKNEKLSTHLTLLNGTWQQAKTIVVVNMPCTVRKVFKRYPHLQRTP